MFLFNECILVYLSVHHLPLIYNWWICAFIHLCLCETGQWTIAKNKNITSNILIETLRNSKFEDVECRSSHRNRALKKHHQLKVKQNSCHRGSGSAAFHGIQQSRKCLYLHSHDPANSFPKLMNPNPARPPTGETNRNKCFTDSQNIMQERGTVRSGSGSLKG